MPARAAAYEESILAVSRRFPDDHEATIFYALLLCAPSSDPAFVRQKKGAAILNGLLAVEPRHPGITHYMIHAFDYPPLAREALPAARSYAKIAPASPHALHMPSHIFTRLGLWQESIASNIASADAARRLAAERHPGAFSFDAMHALDYLEYAYLQIGDDAKARAVFDEAVAASKFDEAQFAAGYGLLAIPARWTLERRDWKGAADLAFAGGRASLGAVLLRSAPRRTSRRRSAPRVRVSSTGPVTRSASSRTSRSPSPARRRPATTGRARWRPCGWRRRRGSPTARAERTRRCCSRARARTWKTRPASTR